MYLSTKDRQHLRETLITSIPMIEQPELRSFFLLMVAMLCDHQELEIARQVDLSKHLHQLRHIEGSLRQMAEKMNEPTELERTIWQ